MPIALSVITQNFLCSGKPLWAVANTGIVATDLASGQKWQQKQIPYGSSWVELSKNNIFSPVTGGDVFGPAVAVADNIAVFNGTSGKVIKDGGKAVSQLQDKIVPTGFSSEYFGGDLSFHALPAAGNPAIEGSNGSFTFQTVTFGNLNGLSFYSSNGSVVGSYTVPPGGASPNFSAGTTSNNLASVVFSNSNGIAFGLDGSTITASHNGITSQSVQPVAVEGSNGSFTFNTVTFGNLNGLSFYSSNNSIVGSYTVPAVPAATSLVFSNSNNVTFGIAGSTLTASAGFTQSVQPVAIEGSNGSFTFSTVTFGNLNGASFYSTNGSMALSYTVPSVPAQSVQPVAAEGSNGSFNFSTLTFGSSNGLHFYTTNGSIVGSYTVPGGGSPMFSAGTTSNTLATVIFSNFNNVSFGLNGSTITAQAGAPMSRFPLVPLSPTFGSIHTGSSAGTGGSTQVGATGYLGFVPVPNDIHFYDLFYEFSATSSINGTGSVSLGVMMGIYTLVSNSQLSLLSSWQAVHMMSQNSTSARSHHWYFGTDSNANSSAANGNISASFSGFRQQYLGRSEQTLKAGNYYFGIIHTMRTSSSNIYNFAGFAFQSAGFISSGTLLGTNGNLNLFFSSLNGVFSTTTNNSAANLPIIPASIHTSAVSFSQNSSNWKIPHFIMQRIST